MQEILVDEDFQNVEDTENYVNDYWRGNKAKPISCYYCNKEDGKEVIEGINNYEFVRCRISTMFFMW